MPFTLSEIRKESRPMLRLAAPLVLSELGWMTMGVVDIMMVGRLPDSADAIGAVSLGSNLFYAIAIFGSGLMLGLDTLVAQSYGRGDVDDCHHSLLNAIYFSFVLAPVLILLLLFALPWLGRSGVDPAVFKLTGPYLKALLWGTPALLWYFALRRYLQSMNIVKPIMFALVTANIVNAFGNYLLVFGKWGAPAMGAEGSGWATSISRIYMMLVLVVAAILTDRHRSTAMFESFAHRGFMPDLARMTKFIKLGLPAAMQIGLEVGVFAVATLLIGKLGALPLSAHQIALVTASYTYMVPLGVSSAAAVRVGQAIGRKDLNGARHAGWTALLMGASFMTCMAIVLWTVPGWIARIFTDDPLIIMASVPLLTIAAVFQLFDGLQVVATGALRGTGDTHTAMFSGLIGYWLFGMPLGAWLCFSRGLGALGFWYGFCIALIFVGVTLLFVWYRRMHQVAGPLPD